MLEQAVPVLHLAFLAAASLMPVVAVVLWVVLDLGRPEPVALVVVARVVLILAMALLEL